MLKLKTFRSQTKGLPDLLPYAALIEPGIILQKDGSLLCSWEFTGLDTASATHSELAFVSNQVSMALQALGTGFMLHVDAIRSPKKAYPKEEEAFFPDKITKLIDDERRAFFGSDVCFNTMTTLSLTYMPSYSLAKNSLRKKGKNSLALQKGLEFFKDSIMMFEDSLASVLKFSRLTEYELTLPIKGIENNSFLHSDLLAHLQHCITGELQPFCVPQTPMYLDALLGGQDLLGGIAPKIGNQHIMVIAIDGLPQESYPVMLKSLDSVPFKLRYSTRFICLDQYDAEREINTHVKGWNQQITSFMDQFFENPNPKVNRDALLMKEDAEVAKTEVQGGVVGAGYMSSTLVMLDEDLEKLQSQAREIRKLLQSLGFTCRIETINALEAYLGSLPGNSYANIRRPLVNTLNLADLLPLSTVYTGQAVCPSPFFPKSSRPLSVLTTDNGVTPFWFNLHVGDLGHTLIFGPTGSGKSTLLGLIASQFPCYKDAQVFAFDKGMSLFPLCKAVGGAHFEIGGDDSELAFTPLQRIHESNSELAFAEEWIASLLTLQGLIVLPVHRNDIHDAMLKLKTSPENMRSLTHFCHVLQSKEIEQAIMHYTGAGVMGKLLDATQDTLSLSRFVVFEMEELMNMGDKNLIPVLTYIFHRIEKALTGQPTILILDEAWIMLGHPVFRAKIREWFKVLRKANCAVVLATQSLSDAKNSGIMDVLVESCPTKILLANSNARQDDQYELYKSIGLNDREIDILAREATPKRDYYISTPLGKRLVQLALGEKTLAFIGASDKESIKRIKFLINEHGENEWQEHWLAERVG